MGRGADERCTSRLCCCLDTTRSLDAFADFRMLSTLFVAFQLAQHRLLVNPQIARVPRCESFLHVQMTA